LIKRYLHDFFGSIIEVLLNLLVAELEDLETVWESGLGCLGLGEVVDYLSV
jgi:hypothetical protein